MVKRKTPSLLVASDDPILRKTAKPVPLENIPSKKIRAVLTKMKKALHAEDDGVAIATPQIGEDLRIFIVNGKGFGIRGDLVFINPEIVRRSKKKRKVEEGCLSLRWLYGLVERSDKVTVRAYDREGRAFELGARGLLAQIFQHEVDHLDGILFTDKAENIRDLPPSRGSSSLRRGEGPLKI